MNKKPESILRNWAKTHTVMTFFLWLCFPGSFALNFAINGSDALPWDFHTLAKYGVHDVSVVGSLIFAIAMACILMSFAFCITGIVLGDRRLDWMYRLFTTLITFAIVQDLSTYA